MKLGVFTSPHLETAVSGIWAICLYCSDDKSVIGARLYRGTPENKTLAAICELYNDSKKPYMHTKNLTAEDTQTIKTVSAPCWALRSTITWNR